MNREEKQIRELWLIDRIVDDCIADSKLRWGDHPLNQELKDLQAELYPEEDTCDYCGREIPEGDFCRHCFDDDYLFKHQPWNINDVVVNSKVTAEDFNKRLKDNIMEERND